MEVETQAINMLDGILSFLPQAHESYMSDKVQFILSNGRRLDAHYVQPNKYEVTGMYYCMITRGYRVYLKEKKQGANDWKED